jgi:hypothetical protein
LTLVLIAAVAVRRPETCPHIDDDQPAVLNRRDQPGGTGIGVSLVLTPIGAGNAAFGASSAASTKTSMDGFNAAGAVSVQNESAVTSIFDRTLMTGLPLLVTNGTLDGAATWN